MIDTTAPTPHPRPVLAHLVCGGRFHDFDYARLRLLTLLAEHEDVRVTVAADFGDTDAIEAADFLVSYTCDVRPTKPQQDALRDAVKRNRWLALHGTNALFDVGRAGAVPVDTPWLVDILGSRFLAHPPIEPYLVRAADPQHPLVRGIDAFETNDELYLCELADGVQVLLDTSYSGSAPGWAQDDWTGSDRHAVAYLYGNVYYLTLGHCRGHHDMRPLVDWYPHVERGAWDLPVFEELLRRGIVWAMHGDPTRGRHKPMTREVTQMAVEVHVDHEVCTGSATCVRWEPKVFALDDTGLAVVLDPGAASDETIITVARACPSGAITVSRDGEVVVG